MSGNIVIKACAYPPNFVTSLPPCEVVRGGRRARDLHELSNILVKSNTKWLGAKDPFLVYCQTVPRKF